MSDNSAAWNQPNVVSFFDNNRLNIEDVYPSEWFFLKDHLKENMTVLDIGCAQGGFAGIIEEKLNDFTYTGVDISKNMISKAKLKHPNHTFHHIGENDYSALPSKRFDMTLVLGILHLHESWRNTIKIAWEFTSSTLIIDLRETSEQTIEDKTKSYFTMDINGNNSDYSEVLPYNVINSGEALASVVAICSDATKISHFGYSQQPSSNSVSPVNRIFANVYCVER
jgi:2-polyprenyl-3-methyl-5-hydroxy-6-metoxy-1,4-benzoquinol methylase